LDFFVVCDIELVRNVTQWKSHKWLGHSTLYSQNGTLLDLYVSCDL
jgi:hypothetical protein